MAVSSVEKDLDTATMTVTSDHAVPVRRLWDAYLDPRQIELFWGPPTWPARFRRHDGFDGGVSSYFMTGPEGEVSAGQWDWTAVDEGVSFEVTDRFCLPDGTPDESMPSMRMRFEFVPTGTGSRLINTTFFADVDELQQLLEMGMEEGATLAMGQVDDVLADGATFAPGAPTASTVIDDTHVRLHRVIRASVDDVWRAHHEEDLVAMWLLGPDGWSMPECTVACIVGDQYRYTWREDATGNSFSSTGEMLEAHPPRREVSTEQMGGVGIPDDAPGTTNELTLTPVDRGTLLSIVVTYPDTETRDAVLGTGMVDGMETSYARMESLLETQ